MSIRKVGFTRAIALAAFAAAAVLASAPRVAADDHVTGVITMRADTSFTMMTEDGKPLIVSFTEATKVKSEKRTMGADQVIPGLRVKVEGHYQDAGFAATEVRFSETDRRIAQAIINGLTPTNQRVAVNEVNIQKHAGVLDQHEGTLGTHGQTLQQHGTDIVANDQKMVATTGAITTRINSIDEFNVIESFVVHFKNGRADLDPQYSAQLQEFAEKAKAVNGYKIQVQGYASAVGPREFNDLLSAKRAEVVTTVLEQRGGITPANIFVPAAMGISEQVAENNTAKGQAENRRVVVTILQSKGLVDR